MIMRSSAVRSGLRIATNAGHCLRLAGGQGLVFKVLSQAVYTRPRRSSSCAAVVAGAGPAGLAVVANLLEKRLSGTVLWVDQKFQAGKLSEAWREVPSNTKVNLFVSYAEAVEPFRKVIEKSPAPNAITALQDLAQDKGCQISYAADMCLMLAEGLCQSGAVQKSVGSVTGANWDDASSRWTVETQAVNSSKVTTTSSPYLVLCTGSSPSSIPVPVSGLSISKIDLDSALAPSVLGSILPKSSPTTVAVIGSSHSGVLVLLNLFNLATFSHPGLRVKWFTRSPLRYAEYKEGYILRDNTGLKGMAADFARDNLEESKLPHSEVGKYVERIDCSKDELAMYEKYLPECTYIAHATGFNRNPLPKLSRNGRLIGEVVYDHRSGSFTDSKGNRIPGLHGAGIAFPEEVTDPEGNVEHAVGLFKFMKYLKRVVDDWVKLSGASTMTAQP